MNCTKEAAAIIIDKYIDREWQKIKEIDFPKTREHEITYEECSRELVGLRDTTKNNKSQSKTIVKFHPSIITANKKSCLSPYKYWQQLKEDKELFRKFYDNRLRCSDWFNEKQGANFHYLSEGYVPEFIYGIGLTTSGKAPKVSYFKPALAKNLILSYLGEYDTIFDPCSGYSGRLIGALAAKKNYIGYDINDITISESLSLYNFIKPIFKKEATLECRDSIETKGEFDCLFTCTPYSDIESWQSSTGLITSKLSCDDWIDILMENYKCKKYVFITDGNIIKHRDHIVEELENTSHFGKNSEYVVMYEV